MADGEVSTGPTDLNSTALNDIATNGALLNQGISQLIEAVGGLSSIVLPATKGGTGHDVYAIGDLLAADTTTSLARLADVATGNALISGGLNTMPSWGKIGLTTHVVGTLPIANGGTNKTSFTAYALVCGGTTTTGALQSVASVGTAGQILTSNGAGTLPTFQTLTDGIAGYLLVPSNQSYRIWLNSPFACTITSTTTQSTAGTCSLAFNINGTPVGGSANSVSTSQQTVTRSSANSVAVGNYIEVTVSSASGCTGLSFMIALTRP